MLCLQRSSGGLAAGLWDRGAEWSVREPDVHVASRAAWKHDPGWRNHEDLHHSERLCGNSTADHGWECLFLLLINFLCVVITWNYSFQTKVHPPPQKKNSATLSLSLSLSLSLMVMFYKGVWEAWTFQNEITLVWQVFVMLCVKSFDYKATLTALINDLCVFVLSVFLWVYMCVNCPEALCHLFCSLISSYRPLPLVKLLQNLPWHSFYEDTHVIPKAIHMHPFSTSSPAAIKI